MKIIFITNEVDLFANSGGAQRSRVLVDAIEDAIPTNAELSKLQISFNEFDRMPNSKVIDLPFSQDIEFGINLEEILTLEPQRLSGLIDKLSKAEYIFVDNCYLAPLISSLISNKNLNQKIIYLSHNYERELKREISKLLAWPESKSNFYLQKVSEFENFLWLNSEARIVCAVNDAVEMNKAIHKDYIVIPNGAFARGEPKLSRNEILTFLGCDSYSLFVASGHPPNIDGFIEGIGVDLGFIPLNSRLVLVGSSVDPIEERIKETKFYETFLKKGSCIRNASDSLLDALYAYANSVILPIFCGGGTSIKSIEALLSGKRLIASSFAFRGIELSSSIKVQINFCTSKNEFKSALSQSLIASQLPSKSFSDIQNLEWKQIQKQAAMEINKLFQKEKVKN